MEDEDELSPSQEIDFCTMGMFIIGKKDRLLCRFSFHVYGFFTVSCQALYDLFHAAHFSQTPSGRYIIRVLVLPVARQKDFGILRQTVGV